MTAGQYYEAALDPSRVVLTRRCACGGYIVADPRHPYIAVAHHNRSVEHRGWWERARGQWQGEP